MPNDTERAIAQAGADLGVNLLSQRLSQRQREERLVRRAVELACGPGVSEQWKQTLVDRVFKRVLRDPEAPLDVDPPSRSGSPPQIGMLIDGRPVEVPSISLRESEDGSQPPGIVLSWYREVRGNPDDETWFVEIVAHHDPLKEWFWHHIPPGTNEGQEYGGTDDPVAGDVPREVWNRIVEWFPLGVGSKAVDTTDRAAFQVVEDHHRLEHPEGDDMCEVCDALDAIRAQLAAIAGSDRKHS